jgi:imidazolonepropionase-like amidohydrolase
MFTHAQSFPLLLCVFISAALIAQDARAPQSLAITHVTIVDVSDGVLRRDQTIVIRHNRINAVGAAGSTAVPDDARVIDAPVGGM